MAVVKRLCIMNHYMYNGEGKTLLIKDISAGRTTDKSSTNREFIDIILKRDMHYPDQSQYIQYSDIKEFLAGDISTISEIHKQYNHKGNIDISKVEYVGYTTNAVISKKLLDDMSVSGDPDFDYVIRLYKESEAYKSAVEIKNNLINLYDSIIETYEG